MNYTTENYKNTLTPSWCAGCSLYGVLQSLTMVLESKQISPNKVNVISGIGCSSRTTLYMGTFGMHTLHGRAIPVALGARLSRPDIPVIVIGGDGDLFSIGMGHFVHAAQKNVNMTVICLDNQMYAMTKNQVSPTSVSGQTGTLSPNGKPDRAMNVLDCAMSSGATFVGRTCALLPVHMQMIISKAFDHKGFSFVEIITPCRTYSPDSFVQISARMYDINELDNHDPHDRMSAVARVSQSNDGLYNVKVPVSAGIYWQNEESTFEDRLAAQNNSIVKKSFDEILKGYRIKLIIK